LSSQCSIFVLFGIGELVRFRVTEPIDSKRSDLLRHDVW